jgi:hypothetical protein
MVAAGAVVPAVIQWHDANNGFAGERGPRKDFPGHAAVGRTSDTNPEFTKAVKRGAAARTGKQGLGVNWANRQRHDWKLRQLVVGQRLPCRIGIGCVLRHPDAAAYRSHKGHVRIFRICHDGINCPCHLVIGRQLGVCVVEDWPGTLLGPKVSRRFCGESCNCHGGDH